MTPIEKAERALNLAIEQMQTRIQAAGPGQSRPDLVQGLVIWASLGETISEYVGAISHYAKQRHAELREKQVSVVAEHDRLLKTGQAQLVQLKANPADVAIHAEIKKTQRSMEALQKILRRGAGSLQNEVNPCIRIFDTVADHVRHLCESEDKTEIKRWTKAILRQPEALYRAHPALPTKGIIDTPAWETSAAAAIDDAANYTEAQARAGFQAMLALDIMIMALSPNPPKSTEEATERANTAVALRTKKLMSRLVESSSETNSTNAT